MCDNGEAARSLPPPQAPRPSIRRQWWWSIIWTLCHRCIGRSTAEEPVLEEYLASWGPRQWWKEKKIASSWTVRRLEKCRLHAARQKFFWHPNCSKMLTPQTPVWSPLHIHRICTALAFVMSPLFAPKFSFPSTRSPKQYTTEGGTLLLNEQQSSITADSGEQKEAGVDVVDCAVVGWLALG